MAAKPFSAMVLALALVAVLPVHAQNSFSSQFDPEKVVTLQGKVVNVRLANPHSSIDLEVIDESGKPKRWLLQGDNRTQLAATGFSRQTIRAGNIITVCGYLSRSAEPERDRVISAEQITLSDGRRFNFASDGINTCLESALPVSARPYATGAEEALSRPNSLPIVPMGTTPADPVVDPPAEGVVTAPVPPVSPRSPAQPPLPSPVGPSVPTAAVQQRIPYDPQEAGYLELYDRGKPVPLAGKVTRVDWAQPNTYIFLTVNESPWVVESSFIQFRQISVSPAINIGDVISVLGYLPRENPQQPLPGRLHPGVGAYLRAGRLIRAAEIVVGGFTLAVGTPPTDEEIQKRSWCAAVRCD